MKVVACVQNKLARPFRPIGLESNHRIVDGTVRFGFVLLFFRFCFTPHAMATAHSENKTNVEIRIITSRGLSARVVPSVGGESYAKTQ